MIKVNIEKAKEIKKDMLRTERAPLLTVLDVEYMRALEAGDSNKLEEVSNKKQALRDATEQPELLNAQTVEELKAVTLPLV